MFDFVADILGDGVHVWLSTHRYGAKIVLAVCLLVIVTVGVAFLWQ